jgi:hypothetical protein
MRREQQEGEEAKVLAAETIMPIWMKPATDVFALTDKTKWPLQLLGVSTATVVKPGYSSDGPAALG